MIVAAFGDVQPVHGDSPGASKGCARSTIPGTASPGSLSRALRRVKTAGTLLWSSEVVRTLMLSAENEKVQVLKLHGPRRTRSTIRGG